MTFKNIYILFIFHSFILFSQENLKVSELNDSLKLYIKERKVLKALQLLEKYKHEYPFLNFEERYSVFDKNLFFSYFLKKNFDSCSFVINKISKYSPKLKQNNLNDFYLNKAYYFKATNQLDSATIYFTKSLSYYEQDTLTNSKNKINIYSGLASIYRLSSNKKKQLIYLKKYLKESKKANNDYKIGAALNNLGVFYDNNDQPNLALINFKEALNYKLRAKNRNSVLQNIGSIYLNHYNNTDSAFYYNKKAINKYTSKRTLAYIHRDLSIIAKREKKHKEGNKELLLALQYLKEDNFAELELKIYNDLAQNYAQLNNYKMAHEFLTKHNKLNDSIKKIDLIEKVEEIETKYKTEKKEKENLKLKQDNLLSEQRRKQNRNLFLGSLSFLVLGGSIGLLTLKNSRKKRLLAEQQQELEKQKNLTLLKEQEINTINAMINGQEKERVRIAEDLHDNIGSVLATLKLHFENLKLNREKKHFNQDELYSKTEKLIDETYLKVRSIAHAKNAGVIANKGLLVAVKLMAEKISDANKIKIEVLDYGLDKRLDNNLEITVFRIIQELTTNIIKHANATEATISISQFDENLNIIIEDNGKGFDINTIKLKDGIGISSIKTRITHLKGTFEVDSTLEKGSSIIMNIPVN